MQTFERTKSSGYAATESIQVALPSRNVCVIFKHTYLYLSIYIYIYIPFLRHILCCSDLTRNYLNGTIPKEWGSTKLVTISLLANRLTGEIPTEITNISTLLELNLEANQFSGILPLELGNLTQIQRMLLNSNKFTGELPISLARLSKLKDFRIGDNQFSGKIPDFIHQNLTNLTILRIEGSGLSGPIPSEISHLQNLTDLRITDLRGSETSTFPPFDKMNKLQTLILRNCSIVGHLPESLGTMTSLKDNLDLSFNKLTGPIPVTYETIATKTTYIYLTGNLLNGSVPSWIEGAKSIDISYNNLSITSQESATCNKEQRNLFANSITNGSGEDACLEGYKCPQLSYNLHINCGGKEVLVNKSTYDDDVADGGDVRFLWNRNRNWAVSTTGNFMNKGKEGFHLVSNKSVLSIENVDLYMTARASPISLTYYGFCLQNGNYTIFLHFAEIVFTDDQTFSSLGRRVFDIYIQEELVQEGFNIAEEAGGNRKAITKNFTAVVSSNTLKIRLNWAGKGTTAIPQRSVYGPLISAITVNSDNPPPTPNSISVGVVVGIVVAVVVVIILVFGILWWKFCLRKKSSLEIGNYKEITSIAHMLKEKGDLMELVDRRLGSDFKKEEVLVTIKVALLCTQVTTTLRPTMSSVVSILEGKSVVDEVVTEASEVLDEKRMEAMRKYYSELSIEVPWTASSTSASDLYPTHLDSSFLEKRNYL
ncbi:hypothetical protein V8G54_027090 [Vigna mungo]|uniref:non-specific serine/threonine protein kinase n=1 Tax=Vigna mungo TaxID=3915 RepID=A0AAQ3RR22_VIGMU